MARTVGLTFSLGARVSRSVASAFDTVSGRTTRMRRDLASMRRMSDAAGKVTSARANIARLREEAAVGKNVTAELERAKRAYRAAASNAKRYGISVAHAARDHARLNREITRVESSIARQNTQMRNSAKRGELQGEVMGTVASAAVVAVPIKMAIDFESAMADAAKTIDGMRDSTGKLTPEYFKMENSVKNLARQLPLTHEEIAALYAAGGQMGMSSAEDLEEFAVMSAHMAVAFGMGTEDAADAIGGYKTKLGLTTEQVREMLDLTNQFANTSSAKEKDIAGIVSRVGALGDIAGIAHKPMTAMAATLASMKIPEEIAATGLKNFMLALAKGDAATKSQKEAFARIGVDAKKLAIHMQEDAEGAMLSVLEKIQTLPKYQQTAILTELFGSESVGAIAPMLTQLDLLKKNFLLAGDSAQFTGAMQQEFENRSRTTANALRLAKNRAMEFGINIGSVALPAIVAAASAFNSLIEPVIGYASANPTVVTGVMALAGGLVALKVASLMGSFGLTLVSDALLMGGRVLSPVIWLTRTLTVATLGQARVTRIAAAAQRIFNVVSRANPIGIVITAISALVGWFAYLYTQTGSVSAALGSMWDACLNGLKTLASPLEWTLEKIGKAVSWFNSDESDEVDKKADDTLAKQGERTVSQATPATDNPTPPTKQTLAVQHGTARVALVSPPPIASFTPTAPLTIPETGLVPPISVPALSHSLSVPQQLTPDEEHIRYAMAASHATLPGQIHDAGQENTLDMNWPELKGMAIAGEHIPAWPTSMEHPGIDFTPVTSLLQGVLSKFDVLLADVKTVSARLLDSAPQKNISRQPDVAAVQKKQVSHTAHMTRPSRIVSHPTPATPPVSEVVVPVTARDVPYEQPRAEHASSPAYFDFGSTLGTLLSGMFPDAAPSAQIQAPVRNGQQSTAVNPSLQLTVHMNGVTDKDFGKRVLESMESQRSAIERFLGGMLKDQSRLTYG